MVLQLGEPGGETPFSLGELAVFNRPLNQTEMESLGAEPPVDPQVGTETGQKRLKLRGRLIESAGMPTVESLDTYRRALIDCRYQVEEVVEGDYREREIVVWHWAILDRRQVRGMPRTAGDVYDLEVELADGHPQLAGERRSQTSELNFLDPYYDVSTPVLSDAP